jgi:catechol 2,3-dioxygenase-like lactoylglutathione lyase family enzyme
VSDDVERSRRFYTEVLGGETVRGGEPTYVELANTWIIINLGGGPTDDKPTVVLETPRPDRVSSFLNIRVADDRGGVQGVEREGRRVSHATDPARNRNPLLHPRPGRLPDRGGPTHRHTEYAVTWTWPVDTSTTP